MYLRQPNLSSSAGQKLALPLAKCTKLLSNFTPHFLNLHTLMYMLKGVKNYLNTPNTQHKQHKNKLYA